MGWVLGFRVRIGFGGLGLTVRLLRFLGSYKVYGFRVRTGFRGSGLWCTLGPRDPNSSK